MKQLYMKVQNNPSVIYGYKGARYFCDREMETLKIIKGLNNERNIALIAPRRIGKTGLIHHVFSQIQEQHPEICCKYIDILATKTLEQFVQLLARNILGKLDTLTQHLYVPGQHPSGLSPMHGNTIRYTPARGTGSIIR